jgi:hypothetical protein
VSSLLGSLEGIFLGFSSHHSDLRASPAAAVQRVLTELGLLNYDIDFATGHRSTKASRSMVRWSGRVILRQE